MTPEVIQFADQDQWLEERRKHITATDLPAILGYTTQWRTALDVWRDKMGLAAPVEMNSRMRAGILLESVIGRWYSEEKGVDVKQYKNALAVDPVSVISASPDFLVDDVYWLESKFTTNRLTFEELPPRFLIQMQAGLACAPSMPKMVLAVCLNGFEFDSLDIERDEGMITMLRQVADEFMLLVMEGTPPAPQTNQDISVLYPRHTAGKIIEAGPHLVDICQEERHLAAAVKETEQELERLRFQIREAMADAEEMHYLGTPIATFRAAKDSRKFDEDRFAKEQPELYAKYLMTKAGSRRLLVKS